MNAKTGATLAIIPARGGSKGLKNKNIRDLNGLPLIAYSIDSARRSKVIDRIFVSTDSPDIAEIARRHGAEVPFLRPTPFAQDETTIEATLQQALAEFEAWSNCTFEIGVFLTPTDIFRRPEWISEAVSILRARPEIDSVFTGSPTFKNYWEALPAGGFQRVRTYMQIYGQRQERLRNGRVIIREDTGLTCASRAHLWRSGRRIGDSVEIIMTDDPATDLDIHTEFDLFLAAQIIKYRGQER